MKASSSLRKGWCPGALRPMQAKDGLLVRLKVSCGVMRARQVHQLAECSELYGNGLLDVTSRGNLQIRGVRPDTLAKLQRRLDHLGLLDPNPEAEAIRNILISPMHGLSGKADIATLAKELERELKENHTLHALPPKFSFLIDDGSLPSLQNIAADVRFSFLRQPDVFGIGIGGTEANTYSLGECEVANLVATATEIAQRFLRLMSLHGVTKMRELISFLGASDVAKAFGFSYSSFESPIQKIDMVPIGMLQIEDQSVLGIGLPFGRLTSSMLEEVASLTARLGDGAIRLTPFRTLLIPGVNRDEAAAWLKDLAGKGFIVESHDPRLKVASCGGQTSCEQATTSAQADGLALTEMLESVQGSGLYVHVSGCKKGCAHPAPAPLTFVANAGLYDVIENGAASGIPQAQGLNLTEVKTVLKKRLISEALRDM